MNAPILSLRGVSKVFTETGSRIELFRDLDFDLAAGDFVSVTGASGAGKSTLLHILGMLDKPTEGGVLFRGEAVEGLGDARLSAARNETIGFVFQFHHLLPDLSALENVMLPLRIGGFGGSGGARGGTLAESRDRAAALLERVGLGDRLHHTPGALSGGERQRAAVARALARDPAVLLCDEPSGNLDERNSALLHDMLADLNREAGVAVLVVTHDTGLAARAAHPLVLREGRLEAA